MDIASGIVSFVRALLGNRAAFAVENLALRHQLGFMRRSVKRPRLRFCPATPQRRNRWHRSWL